MNYLQQSTILIRWQPRNSKILQLYFYKEHLFCLTLQFLIFLLTLINKKVATSLQLTPNIQHFKMLQHIVESTFREEKTLSKI